MSFRDSFQDVSISEIQARGTGTDSGENGGSHGSRTLDLVLVIIEPMNLRAY